MNIRQAKQQVKNAMTAYFSRDEFGEYEIPLERQRPIFLMGPPGIGKTAIMQQIAQELGVGLVSYSMTHHTRQSAIGLPFIAKKNYGGKEYSVEIACLNGLEVDLLFRYTIGGSNDVKRFFAPRLLSLALNALEEPEEELYE